jgi:lipopolysaccharide transport system ATP-binding protein
MPIFSTRALIAFANSVNCGTTLLLVSHDKGAIQSICDRAILLNAGRVAIEGEPEAVMDYYNAMLADHQNQVVKQVKLDDGKVQTISGTGEVTIGMVQILDDSQRPIEVVAVGQAIILRVTANAHKDIDQLVLGYGVKDRLGQMIFGTNTYHIKKVISQVKKGSEIVFDVALTANFGEGTYSVVVAMSSSDTHLTNNYDWRDRALVFNVINTRKPIFVGVSWIDHHVQIKQIF